MADIADLLTHSIEGDVSKFETAFNDIMSQRATAALNAKYSAMYSKMEVEADPKNESDVVNEHIDLEESIKPWADGKIKIGDKLVHLSNQDIAALNYVYNGLDNNRKKDMIKEITKDKKEFDRFLSFARDLHTIGEK